MVRQQETESAKKLRLQFEREAMLEPLLREEHGTPLAVMYQSRTDPEDRFQALGFYRHPEPGERSITLENGIVPYPASKFVPFPHHEDSKVSRIRIPLADIIEYHKITRKDE